MNRTLAACAAFTALAGAASVASAQIAPSLGAAQSFAVLGGSTVTNTGPSVITGDLGVSPGTAVTGFPPGLVVSGSIHTADAVALAAQNSVTTAYNALASQACTQDLTGQNLGGLTLTPGVYCFSSSAQLTGVLTLNAQGNANAVFIFKIGSTLTTASGSSVALANGGSLCNIFWQVGSSATLGTTTSFAGNILALTSITLTTGATVTGRTLARNGAVTLDSNTVTTVCAQGVPPTVCPVVTLSPAVLPSGTTAVAYSQTITASGGTAPYSFAVTAGTLPTGLTLTPGGLLAGTPTAAGSFTFTVRGTDANGCFGSIAYTIVIAAAPAPPAVCPVITLSPPVLPNGTVGTAYNVTISGSGGTAPYSFGVTSGTLPTGLTLTALGVLSGTPATAATSTFTIRGTDANGCFADVAYSVVIAAAAAPPPECPAITISPSTLPAGAVGQVWSQTLTASGGTAPYTFGVTVETLPAGLTLTYAGALGLISGTPTAAGNAAITVRATDANGCFAERPFTIAITMAVPTLPQAVALLLGLGLTAAGYVRLRRRARSD
jgi:large repetitive protein